MRVKEYANLYRQGKITPNGMAIAFYEEMQDLIKVRHTHCDAAFEAIFEEMDQKWRAFCKLVPEFKPEGFQLMLKTAMPEVYHLWKG